ncbi:MAG: class I SAM-dependent methyltransferase [Nocardioides sp.]
MSPAGSAKGTSGTRKPVPVTVDDDGIHLHASAGAVPDVVVDASFDGRRIWSFWPVRDAVPTGGEQVVPWPKALAKFLDGRTHFRIAEHTSGTVWFDDEIRLGTSDERIAVVDPEGHPLALDKSMKRVRTFETRTPEQVAPLMAAIGEVLEALSRAGVEPFLAYGTLLGAVREGALIGHDSDADLGYVSDHSHPVDVMRESFELQRRLTEMGYPTMRYSGAAFKVDVVEADGSLRGLDVFGGFMRDGHLHLMGEIRTPFERAWIHPLGTASLEGHVFPVPADTDRFLAATYGPHWRTPDPAFKFETPQSTHRRLNGWFRGIRVHRGTWDGAYAAHPEPTSTEPSDLVRLVHEREPAIGDFIDVGCGYGVDVLWMADQGVPSLGLDHAPTGFAWGQRQAAEQGSGAQFGAMNLLEMRSVLAVSALVAHRSAHRSAHPSGAPRVVMGNHLVDALDARGRTNLARSAAMMLRGGGRLYLKFLTHRGDDGYATGRHIHPVPAGRIRAVLEEAGARIVDQRRLLASGPGDVAKDQRSKLCRMVATWE